MVRTFTAQLSYAITDDGAVNGVSIECDLCGWQRTATNVVEPEMYYRMHLKQEHKLDKRIAEIRNIGKKPDTEQWLIDNMGTTTDEAELEKKWIEKHGPVI